MKICRVCGVEKSHDSYGLNKRYKDGRSSACRQCVIERQRIYRINNRDRYHELQRKWKSKNKDKVHNYYIKNADRSRNQELIRKYGITLDQYNQMLELQTYSCAICGSKETKNKKSFNVDHCHITGKVRSLLCNLCNLAIGAFKDDPNLMEAAANYIRKHRGLHAAE